MKTKNLLKIFALLSVLLIGLLVVGCSTSETSNGNTVSASAELYTCGMHPNVIQEGEGNCPQPRQVVCRYRHYNSTRGRPGIGGDRSENQQGQR